MLKQSVRSNCNISYGSLYPHVKGILMNEKKNNFASPIARIYCLGILMYWLTFAAQPPVSALPSLARLSQLRIFRSLHFSAPPIMLSTLLDFCSNFEKLNERFFFLYFGFFFFFHFPVLFKLAWENISSLKRRLWCDPRTTQVIR